MALNDRAGMFCSRRGFLLVALVMALLAGALFLPGLKGGFVLDDGPNILTNRLLHLSQLGVPELIYAALSFSESGWRALPMLSFALDYWRGEGLDAATFKATNVLIHVVTALALALFFRRLLRMAGWELRQASITALLLALVWAIHPLQVSSVLYVVQRMQTLCTLFVVLSLWAYLGMRQAQMEGGRSRGSDAMLVMFPVLALLSKEDAALLPLYMLALELTVLQFRAANPDVSNALRKGYLLLAVVGLAVYLFVIVPRYWRWDAWTGREFSAPERLLTQGRVLVMYLRQMLFPLPSMMPFNYDTFPVSRGWLQPCTTVPAWLLLFGLSWGGWRLRLRRPLFAFGVMLFFVGHFMTSNVIPLELVFEHRNHLPLIGVVLAVGDLLGAGWKRWAVGWKWRGLLVAGAVLALGTGTVVRAHAWGDPLRFAKYSVQLAPQSERAWLALGGAYVDLSKWQADSPYLAQAIAALEEGQGHIDSVTLLSNLVLYKTVRGSVTQGDWAALHEAVRRAPNTFHSMNVIPGMVYNLRMGVPLDEGGVYGLFEIALARNSASKADCVLASHFAMDRGMPGAKVLPFVRCAVALSRPDDRELATLLQRLNDSEQGKWVLLQIRDGQVDAEPVGSAR